MKKLLNTVMLVLLVSMVSSVDAADTKVNGRLYADWNLDMTDGAESANSFNVGRAYVTVKSKLSEFTSVRITTDLRETSGFDGYSIILKYGYIDWKPKFGQKKLMLRFGLQPTLYIDNMNKLWNRRYLEKTVGDKNKFLTTSDLGVSAIVNIGEKGKSGYAALQVLNGTSYTDTEEMNKNKDFGAFVLLKPLANNENLKRSRLLGQFYTGTQNEMLETVLDSSFTPVLNYTMEASQYKNQIASVGGMLGYSDALDLGFDANFKTTGQGYVDTTGAEIEDVKSTGMSVFGTYYLNGLGEEDSILRTLNLFGRYDILDPNTDTDDDGKSLMIVGVECNPTKGFKASVNFRTTSYQADSKDSESHVFVNTLFKF